MDFINIKTTYKAEGKEYEKIVFWNRFLRNKTELILTFLPAIASIIAFSLGYRETFLMIVYLIFFIYPVFVYRQFKNSVSYHLSHRDAMESASCTVSLLSTSILVEFDEYEEKKSFKWDNFTTVYDKLGYYMFFTKGDMQLMLKKEDIPNELKEPVLSYIKEHIDHNKCIVK